MNKGFRNQIVVGLALVSAILSNQAYAQTTVTRYVSVNNTVIPFDVQIAPTTIAIVSANGVFNYNKDVTTANLSWTTVIDADQYKLEWYDVSSAQWSILYDGASTLHFEDDLPVGIATFRVIACGGGLCGIPSAGVSLSIETSQDKDLDGVTDEYDLCLGSVQGANVSGAGCVPLDFDANNDGIVDDTDGDGVTDDLDWCAATNPNDPNIDARGCSPDQIDSDDDGTADYLDAYPHQHDTQCTI